MISSPSFFLSKVEVFSCKHDSTTRMRLLSGGGKRSVLLSRLVFLASTSELAASGIQIISLEIAYDDTSVDSAIGGLTVCDLARADSGL